MTRRQSYLPNHLDLIKNNVSNILAVLFIIVALIVFVSWWSIRYAIDRDCNNYYKRDTGLFSYWIHVEIGSKHADCVQPYRSE